MKLLVVITSYRAKELTLECLKSLAGEVRQNPEVRVGICDNGNEDDTAAYLENAIGENGWQDWAYVRSVTPNRGFSGGNNVIYLDCLTRTDTEERSRSVEELRLGGPYSSVIIDKPSVFRSSASSTKIWA